MRTFLVIQAMFGCSAGAERYPISRQHLVYWNIIHLEFMMSDDETVASRGH